MSLAIKKTLFVAIAPLLCLAIGVYSRCQESQLFLSGSRNYGLLLLTWT